MSKAWFATGTVIVAMAMLAGACGGAPAAAGQAQTTTSITYGPFTVPAAQGPGQPGQLDNAIVRQGGCRTLDFCLDMPVTKPCEDCFITEIVPDLVDASTGETINFASGGMLHHVVAVNWSAPDATCPPSLGPGLINWLGLSEGGNERFFASGNERTVLALPEPYGLRVDRGDDWGLIAHLMNMTDAPRQVGLKFTFTWAPAGSGLEPVTPVWLDIDNCGDSEVDLPQGYSDTEWDWRSTLAGQFVAMAGHLHDNGISIAAENASRDEGICTSLAGYEEGSPFAPVGPGAGTDPLHPADWWQMTSSDHPSATLASYLGHIAGMSGCLPSAGVDVGDTIRLHAQYNLGQNAHMQGGQMGIMVAYLHESPGPEPGPGPAPQPEPGPGPAPQPEPPTTAPSDTGPAPQPVPLTTAPAIAKPSNEFHFGKVKRNKKKGIAFLLAFFPGPGEVGLTGRGLDPIGLGPASARKSIAVQGGRVKLQVKPAKTGKRARKIRRKLRNRGRAGVKVAVTYLRSGGVPNTLVRKLKLVRK